MARSHLLPGQTLYRIFVYDSPPLTKKVHHPITKRVVDFSKLDSSIFRQEWHRELLRSRKVALRLGTLADNMGRWVIRPDKTKRLLNKKLEIQDLTDTDVYYDVRQKGVDMKIGLDIASLAYKRFVNQIILVAGDSDFVPAAKLARREGIDFVLDPMWHHVRDELLHHIDGLQSFCNRPNH